MTLARDELFIGLMSGTSLDGVDGVLAQIDRQGAMQVLGHAFTPFDVPFRAELLALNSPGHDELHRSALAGNRIALHYAQVVRQLLQEAGLPTERIRAIGAHGQTVRHRPQAFEDLPGQPGIGYTLQLLNPSLLAERSGIDVVADLRSRDLAAGGQGAPLVPAFHRGVFGRAGQGVCVLNIGGISNLSVLRADGTVLGWDCGPGNALMDHWCQTHTGQAFDADGRWAASGQVQQALLARLLNESYLDQPPPKSTGRDLFNPAWLEPHLLACPGSGPADVQASLTAFTAQVCARDVLRHAPDVRSLVVCGGGALNGHLMQLITQALPGVQVESSTAHGLPPLQVEAAAFAWLAFKAVHREPASLPSVTGARGERVLGALYPR